jgi:hypothetical protein
MLADRPPTVMSSISAVTDLPGHRSWLDMILYYESKIWTNRH